MFNERNKKGHIRKGYKLTEEEKAYISLKTKEGMKKVDMKFILRNRNCTGKLNPMWKGGVSALRSLLAYRCMKELKPRILERDEYRCTTCGGEATLIHHIIPLSQIKDDVIKNNPHLSLINDIGLLSDIIMKAHDKEKIVSLCKNCHAHIHYFSKKIFSKSVNSRTDNTEPSLNKEGVESRREALVGKQDEGVFQSERGLSI